MKVRFDFTAHIAFRAQELGIQGHQDRDSPRIGFGTTNEKCVKIDALAEECRSLGLSVTGPDVVTRQWTPCRPVVVAVVIDPMGWVDVTIPKDSE